MSSASPDAAEHLAGKERMRAVMDRFFDLTLAMLCTARRDGNTFENMNPAWERTLGWTREELCSRSFIEFIHPDDVQATFDIIGKMDDGALAVHFENRYRHKNGSWVWLSWVSALVNGVYYAAAIDITPYKQAEERVRQRTAELEVVNTELETFSYSVAHDLRAPLRSIDGFSQALLEDCADRLDADGKRYLTHVRESAQQMGELIDDLLSLSRVTRAELRRERVDVTALVRSVLERLRESQPDRQVDVVVQDGLVAQADPRLLDVALTNLLGNAWKFTSKRTSSRIEFAAKADEHPPVYFVRDNGAGFDAKYADKLFGVFQRLHAAHEFEGTGIGLAMVRRIVSRHGGRVWAEGEVNRGATFYFTLEEGRT
jgi:PAS domain S-box-containing protein